jgi:hypothetical protein
MSLTCFWWFSWLERSYFFLKPSLLEKYTDQRIWNDYKLRDRFVGKSYGVVADRGFILNPHSYL